MLEDKKLLEHQDGLHSNPNQTQKEDY